MTRTRLGLLSLCVAIFALMAFQVAAAQAVSWLIFNNGEEGIFLKAQVKGESEPGTDVTLLTTIKGIAVEILCTATEAIGVNLESGGALTNGGKLKFTGCTVKLNKAASECEPKSTGKPVGTIETLETKGQIKATGITLLEPKTGSTFVIIEMGPACPIGTKVVVAGVFGIEDCLGQAFTAKIIHLVQENFANTSLFANGAQASIDGSGFVSLAGAHNGLLWSA